MSGRRRSRTPREEARPELTRRRIVAGLAAAAVVVGGASPAVEAPPLVLADPAIAPCKVWLAQQREITRLQLRWQRRESWLADHFPWFRLSPDEQRALAEAQELYEIDARLEALFHQSARQLVRLPRFSATSLDGVRRKLVVVAKAIEPDDYPLAHRVLVSALTDLKTIGRP